MTRSFLTDADWRKLRAEIDAKQVRVVALDLPTSWQMAATGDEFTRRMFAAINAMLLDMLAAVARKDYEDRRRRQAQGIVKAKAEGLYRGRAEDTARNEGIAEMLKAGMSWSSIQAATGCSRATVAKVAQRRSRRARRRYRRSSPSLRLRKRVIACLDRRTCNTILPSLEPELLRACLKREVAVKDCDGPEGGIRAR